MFVHFFIQFPLPHFVQILPLLVNGKHIKNGGQAYGFSCNYFYEDCPLAEGIHYTGDEWKSSTRVSVFNTFDVWKYVVPFFLISFFSFMYAQMMFILKCPCVIEGVKLDVGKHYSDNYVNSCLKVPVSVRPQTVFPVTVSCLRGAGIRSLSISPLENAFKRFAVYRQPHAIYKGVKSYFHHE